MMPSIDWKKAYGAEQDRGDYPVFVDDLNAENLKKFGKSEYSYFMLCHDTPTLQLNQNEFKKNSPWCTIYAHFANYLHYHGENISKLRRKAIIEWYVVNGLVGEDAGASTMIIAEYRGEALKAVGLDVNVDTYFFGTGDEKMLFLMKYYNHAFVSSFVISDDFIEDRKDNLVLDGKVHGGKERNGHAILYEMLGTQIVVGNSYAGRRDNHFGIEEGKIEERFTKKRKNGDGFVREFSTLHIYS